MWWECNDTTMMKGKATSLFGHKINTHLISLSLSLGAHHISLFSLTQLQRIPIGRNERSGVEEWKSESEIAFGNEHRNEDGGILSFLSIPLYYGTNTEGIIIREDWLSSIVTFRRVKVFMYTTFPLKTKLNPKTYLPLVYLVLTS